MPIKDRERRLAQKREHYARNKERLAFAAAQYRETNADKIKLSRQAFREKNREKLRLQAAKIYEENRASLDWVTKNNLREQRKYREKSTDLTWLASKRDASRKGKRQEYYRKPGVLIERVRRRRGKIRQALDLMTPADRAEVEGMYQFCRIFPKFEVDHIVPLNGKTVSGLHVVNNLQVIPRSVNRSKGNKFHEDHVNG